LNSMPALILNFHCLKKTNVGSRLRPLVINSSGLASF
jgi:hypothetical protein